MRSNVPARLTSDRTPGNRAGRAAASPRWITRTVSGSIGVGSRLPAAEHAEGQRKQQAQQKEDDGLQGEVTRCREQSPDNQFRILEIPDRERRHRLTQPNGDPHQRQDQRDLQQPTPPTAMSRRVRIGEQSAEDRCLFGIRYAPVCVKHWQMASSVSFWVTRRGYPIT